MTSTSADDDASARSRSSASVQFGSFRLDLDSGELHDAAARVLLQDKPFRLLATLVRQPGALVTREELRWALWPDGTHVDYEHGLNTAVKRLRDVLKDSAAVPRFIETVPRRGYRFIAPVRAVAAEPPAPSSTWLVGRQRELADLHDCLERAASGNRQCVFVTGEAGIGKTALIERFLKDAPGVHVGEGCAFERYGAVDAYGPLLDALRSLARVYPLFAVLLRKQAPTWLAHLPGVAGERRRQPGDPSIATPTRARMLREIVAALEAAAANHSVVLVLEDLHWADQSTLDVVAALARRRASARLLLLCTCRSAEAIANRHDVHRVKEELRVQARCSELALRGVNAEAVGAYLAARFPGLAAPADFARALHARTDGNPLFVINYVDALLDGGHIAHVHGVPALRSGTAAVRKLLPRSLHEVIRMQLRRLPAEWQTLVQAASVIGVQFTVRLSARVTDADPAAVEDAFERLARRNDFIERVALRELPGGVATIEYRFTHALYCDVLYDVLGPDRAAPLHRAVGEALEEAFGSRPEIAAEIAVHFDRARLPSRAVPFYAAAANLALRRAAYSAARQQLQRALQLLEGEPPSVERQRKELELQLGLGAAFTGIEGFSSAGAARPLERALDLAASLPDSPQMIPALFGLQRYYASVGPVGRALAIARRTLERARSAEPPEHVLEALFHRATIEFYAGHLRLALSTLCEAFDPRHDEAAERGFLLLGIDGRQTCRITFAYTLWYAGAFANALEKRDEIAAALPGIGHADTKGCGLAWLAAFESLAREPARALLLAEQAVALAQEHEDTIVYRPFAAAVAGRERCRRGEREGMALIEESLPQIVPSWQCFAYGLLADACLDVGAFARGLGAADEGLAVAARTGVRFHEAELLRLRAEILLRIDAAAHAAEAEESLERALAVAREQEARWLELRVALCLCRASTDPGKHAMAARALAAVVAALAGEDCPDLRDARTLTARLR